MVWLFMAYDRPEVHPWISEDEKELIQKYTTSKPADTRKVRNSYEA